MRKKKDCWIVFELSNIYKDTDDKLKAFVDVKITDDKENIIERYRTMHLNVGDTISLPIEFNPTPTKKRAKK